MKKLIVLVGMLLMSTNFIFAQEETEKAVPVNGPVISFEKTVHDYGEIQLNGNGECEFEFTNIGNEPLILQKPTSSCGCTVPTWPKQPILPGEKDVIKVTYNTKRVGPINKSVTVTSNDKNGTKVILRIKGTVLQAPAEAAPIKAVEKEGMPLNTEK